MVSRGEDIIFLGSRIKSACFLCVPVLLMMGCSTGASLESVPAQWNSCYYPCLATAFDHPEVMNEAYYRLGFRAGSLEYWRLCQKVIEGEAHSDYVIIVEQLPEEDISQYWYVLIMARADQVTVYAGGINPLAGVDLGDQTDGDRAAKPSPIAAR